MSQHQRVLDLIELMGEREVLKICRGMNDRKLTRCGISKQFIDYRSSDLKPEITFEIRELLDGLSEYQRIIKERDQVYIEIRSLFEPMVRSTDYFKKYGKWSSFSFEDGKYSDEIIQAMFDVFKQTYQCKNENFPHVIP